MCIQEKATANASLVINGAPSLQRGPWSCICHTSVQIHLLTFFVALFPAWHVFRLHAHTQQVEAVTGNHNTSPTCDPRKAFDIQDEQHVFFHYTCPHAVSLRRTYVSLSPPTGSHDVSCLPLSARTTTIIIFSFMIFLLQHMTAFASIVTPKIT